MDTLKMGLQLRKGKPMTPKMERMVRMEPKERRSNLKSYGYSCSYIYNVKSMLFSTICATPPPQLEGGTLLFAGATDWKLVGRKGGELGKSTNTQWSPTR